jgi:hypothetical protein
MDVEATEDPLKNLNASNLLEDEEDEGGANIDYRRMFKRYVFISMKSHVFRKDKSRFQKIPKRGEKDFEPDGTRKQRNFLQESRDAMYSALSFDAGLYVSYS